MRIGLIVVAQETSSFNPVLTTFADFEQFGVYEGREILDRLRGNGPVGGYLESVEASGRDVETVPIIRGATRSGGRLSREAFDYFNDKIRDGLSAAGELDGLVMLLHGAASAEGIDDTEGEMLETARSVVGNDLPLALMLDHHANVTEQMMEHCDLLVGFRTQPHDQLETARALTDLGLRLFAGEIAPTMTFRKLRMITHQEQYLTASGPMKILFDRARQMEQDPRVLTCSPFPMQPWLDAAEGGWAMVVATDGDQALAEQLADELADLAWSMRDDFMIEENRMVDDAVRAADAADTGVVILSDTGDSVLGGSTGDSTVLLESILRLQPTHPALVPMLDTIAARTLAEAGVGATVTIELGGRSGPFFTPLEVTGVVRAVGDGKVDLPDHPLGRCDMGKTIAFDLGAAMVLVTEYAGVAGVHPGAYRHVGLEPSEYQMLVMKTASNFQWMAPFTASVIRAATPGPTQSDVAGLPWEHLPRPIFPIDPISDWKG